MSQNKWDDDKIEDLLSTVPKVTDNRTKDEILQRLKDDGIFEDEPSEPVVTTKKIRSWIPPLITVAAIALIALMIPSLMNQMDGREEVATSLMDAKQESTEMSGFSNKAAENEVSQDVKEMSIMADDSAINLRTSVYPEDLEGFTAFHIGLSYQANSIPFTILIANEVVMEDLGKSDPTGVELYNYYAPLFDEEAIGFLDYHPYKGVISEEENRVIHTLPAGHGYDMGSAAMGNYNASLIDTFKPYKEVVFLNEDGTPIEFDQEGEPRKPLQLHSGKYPYFKFIHGDGSEYLSTMYGGVTYATVEEALENMKIVEGGDFYKTVILPDVNYTVTVNEGTVYVEFTNELDLLSYDQVEAMKMIEGILLTAASFDLEVKFENIVQTNWGGFDFENPLPIPVGPNKLPLLIK